MALDGTNAGMQASVADFLNRSDLTATIPDFIVLAEAELNRRLRVRQMVATTTLTVSSATVALPADFLAVKSLYNANFQPVDQQDADALQLASWQSGEANGTPTLYAVIGSNISFLPIPASSMSVYLTYFQRIPALASNPSGNWLSLSSPDAYLFGALTASAPYLQDDERLAVWSGLYANAVDGIMQADAGQWGARLTPQPSQYQII